MERFKKPDTETLTKIAILFSEQEDGSMAPLKTISDMVGMAEFIVDRLYANGSVDFKSPEEILMEVMAQIKKDQEDA